LRSTAFGLGNTGSTEKTGLCTSTLYVTARQQEQWGLPAHWGSAFLKVTTMWRRS
jgi:hypothetical protein